MSDDNGNGNGNGDNGNGDNGNGKVQFRRKDGIEKDGYICFPVEAPTVEVEKEEEQKDEREDRPPTRPVRGTLSTCPEDPRFPQQNRSGWCYRMYIDFHRCRLLLGENSKQCSYFYNCYNSICPNAWIEKWDEQIKDGSFARDISHDIPPRPAPCP